MRIRTLAAIAVLPLIIGNAREGSVAIWAMYEKGLLRPPA